MKTIFTKKEMYQLKGCYNDKALEELDFMKLPKDSVTLDDILAEPQRLLHANHKIWFIFNSCGLTLKEQQEISVTIAQRLIEALVEDSKMKAEIQHYLIMAEDYVNGKIALTETLLEGQPLKMKLGELCNNLPSEQFKWARTEAIRAAWGACIFMEYTENSSARGTQTCSTLAANQIGRCSWTTEKEMVFLKEVLQPYQNT